MDKNFKSFFHRLEVRFATNQMETRPGLQKVGFGPVFLLRSLRRFDRLDPRDPRVKNLKPESLTAATGNMKNGGNEMAFLKPEDMNYRELFPGCRARLVHTEKMTISQVILDAGAVVPEHTHEHEQVSNVIQGKFEFTIGGKTHILEPGQIAVIPSNVPHVGKALTDCYIIDVFSPVREDYK